MTISCDFDPETPHTGSRRSRKDSFMSSVGGRDRSRSAHKTTINQDEDNQARGSNNQFNSLPDNVMEHEITNNNSVSNKSQGNNKRKMPPFTIINSNINNLKENMNEAYNIDMRNITIKLTTYGIKVYTCSDSDYSAMRKLLVDKKYEFFTHTLDENRKVKVCLYGLWRMNTDELKVELRHAGVIPSEIKILESQNKRYADHCIYLLHFWKRDNIKITDLRRIKAVANCIVKWDYYSPRTRGPTQCSKCQEFGHGSENCYMKPKCVRCGEQHDSKQCKYLPKIKDSSGNESPDLSKQIPLNNVRCANCKKNGHTANFKGCEARKKYVEIQNKVRSNNFVKQNPSRPPPVTTSQQFPYLPQQRPISHSPNTNQQQNVNMWENPPHLHMNTCDDKLFSYAEMMQIMNEMMHKLAACRTKQQQLSAIGEITFKYLYGST